MVEMTPNATGTMGNWTAHIDETKRGLAKLLAKENVTVIHANVKTASFDLQSRTLTLPKWQNITVDQYDLLIGHEVGHARYSDDLDSLKGISRGLHTFINVLEDTRIERLMKEEFPGLRGSFRRGYADFATKGPLFQLDRPIEKYAFIDRVNIHYKIGAHVAVPFSADEQAILRRIDALRTMRDAVNLAKELYAAEKEQKQQEQQDQPKPAKKQQKQPKSVEPEAGDDQESGESEETEPMNGEGDGDESEPSDDQSDDASGDDESGESEESGDDTASNDDVDAGDDSEESAEGQESNDDTDADAPAKGEDTDPVSETDIANSEAMQSLGNDDEIKAAQEPVQIAYGRLPVELVTRQTVTNAKFVADVTDFLNVSAESARLADDAVRRFTEKHSKTVASMALEFERRKTAKRMERAKTSRSGRLDMGKLHAYKFREDLFQTVTTLPNGQNHGIALVLDGSGSMDGVMGDTLEQVMIFASFAAKCKIPFRAYMFLTYDTMATLANSKRDRIAPADQIVPDEDFQMVNIVDTTAKNWKAQTRIMGALMARFSRESRYSYTIEAMPYTKLGGTPLNSSLVLMDAYVEEMKRVLRLEKMTLVVCTDGDDTNGMEVRLSNMMVANQRYSVNGFVNTKQVSNIVRDRVTRKVYSNFVAEQGWANQTVYRPVQGADWNMLVDAFQTRHNCRVVAIKIAEGLRFSKRYGTSRVIDAANQFFTREAREDRRNFATTPEASALVKSYEDNGQFVVPADMTACDCALVLKGNAMVAEEADSMFGSRVTSGMNTKQIAKAFTQANVAATTNKVFIRAVMPFLA
jgi:hypothetical protein